jgi:thiamine-phosphate pyrophosphorylase
MKLVVISPSKTTELEPRIVTTMFEHGMDCFHLRKLSMRTREMIEYIEKIPAHFHNRMMIHSHHKLAGRYDLKGVHLTHYHLEKKFGTWMRLRLLKARKPHLTISSSYHKISHVYQNKNKYTYAMIGSIFDPVSGNYHAGFSENSLRTVIDKSDIPLVARGGTLLENIERCHALGFAGMAFSGGIWKHEKPLERFDEIINRFRELKLLDK